MSEIRFISVWLHTIFIFFSLTLFAISQSFFVFSPKKLPIKEKVIYYSKKCANVITASLASFAHVLKNGRQTRMQNISSSRFGLTGWPVQQ